MNRIWNYKINLNDKAVFDVISERIGKSFPEDLKSFILEHNAAAPENNCVTINGVEHIYDETLSFNEREEEVLTVFFVMDSIDCKGYIPFARDPFGNYYLYSVDTGKIAYYTHEEQRVEKTELSLENFIESLYQ